MSTAPDSNGIPRITETDRGDDGTFSALLNLALEWVSTALDPHGATLTRTTDAPTTVADSATALPFQVADIDGMTWDSATPARLYATKDGTYAWDGLAAFGSTGTGTSYLRKNGATDASRRLTVTNESGIAQILHPMQLVSLLAGDYVELVASTTGGPWTLYATTRLRVERINGRV